MNPQIQMLTEQAAKGVIRNLFGTPHAKISGSLEEVLVGNKDLLIISEEDQAEVMRLLDEAKKVDGGDGKSIFGAGFVLGRLLEQKTVKPVKALNEHAEPQYLIEDIQDKLKLVTELLVSKHHKTSGRPLTESEEIELIRHIREDSLEGREIIVLEAIKQKFPGAEIEEMFGRDRAYFQSASGMWMVEYRLEKGKVLLSEAQPVDLAFVPKGTLKKQHKGFLHPGEAALTEEENHMRQHDLRVAGLEKLPKIKTDPTDPKQLTEQMHKERRVAGLE